MSDSDSNSTMVLYSTVQYSTVLYYTIYCAARYCNVLIFMSDITDCTALCCTK